MLLIPVFKLMWSTWWWRIWLGWWHRSSWGQWCHFFSGLVFLSPCTLHLCSTTHPPTNFFSFIPNMHEFLCALPVFIPISPYSSHSPNSYHTYHHQFVPHPHTHQSPLTLIQPTTTTTHSTTHFPQAPSHFFPCACNLHAWPLRCMHGHL